MNPFATYKKSKPEKHLFRLKYESYGELSALLEFDSETSVVQVSVSNQALSPEYETPAIMEWLDSIIDFCPKGVPTEVYTFLHGKLIEHSLVIPHEDNQQQ